MNKKKLKRINRILYSLSFCSLILSLIIFFIADKVAILQEEVFYSIGSFFVFLLLACMALILFLNGFYEIKNPNWFSVHSKGLINKKPKTYYEPEAVFGSALDIHTSKTTLQIKALLKIIIGAGIFVSAIFVFIFAVRLFY